MNVQRHGAERNNSFGPDKGVITQWVFSVEESLQTLEPLHCLESLGDGVGIRLPLTGAEIPKIGKRGFRSQKTPISHHPRKGCSESKNPHFPCSALYRNGDFLTRNTLFWGGGKWGFFDSETLFSPDFGDFGPCKGQTNS